MLHLMKTRIVKQLNTEKTHSMEEKGVYTFLFSIESRKADIRKVIEKTFSVKVDNIRTLTNPIKVKSFRGRHGIQSRYKKVYVRVAKGMKIAVSKDIKV